ncbi:hypothetical protein H7F15_16640 [Pontibacter sp. Tf4]|uniref:hypothetical protein n=1 Tax=Pontibacter sp. Tf4 TaxID=2761620 RepID=UPI001628ED3F|nr:hypothetical protein [Pontibacter sp. Tf4]MBB6612672.1 hypothetical protein [Pontibacter sp. Tf4]
MAHYNTIPGAGITYDAQGRPVTAGRAKAKSLVVSLRIQAVVSVLAAATVVFISLSLIGSFIKYTLHYDSVYGFIPQFNLDTEGNIPTFFAALLLMASGFLFLLIALYKRSVKDAFVQQWFLLACMFMYMAVDEACEIHGLVMRPLNEFYSFSGAFHFSWVIPGMAVIFVVLVYFARFFFALNNTFKARFMAPAIVYMCGLIGMEMISGAYASMHGEANITYEVLTTLEEALEMAGLVLLIRALLLYIQANISDISFKLPAQPDTQI